MTYLELYLSAIANETTAEAAEWLADQVKPVDAEPVRELKTVSA